MDILQAKAFIILIKCTHQRSLFAVRAVHNTLSAKFMANNILQRAHTHYGRASHTAPSVALMYRHKLHILSLLDGASVRASLLCSTCCASRAVPRIAARKLVITIAGVNALCVWA